MVVRYCVFLCVVSCCLWCVICDLNLSEGSACVTEGRNGTCVELIKCDSAALVNLYLEAGFDKSYEFPKLPETCSHKDGTPVICCADCTAGKSSFRHSAIAPLGLIISKKGPVAWAKCYDYFKSLPYPCRGIGNVKVETPWNATMQCNEIRFSIALALGGRDAERWEFPHMALLGYGDDVNSAQWLCGGSIISERFILTAAHCSSTRALGSIKFVALGLLKRTDPKKNWKIYNIKRIITHPDYKAPAKYHDIALLETETEINFGRDVLPACLDVGKDSKNTAEAAGWGRLGHRQALADNLQVVDLHKYNESVCSMMYQPHRHLKLGYDNETQMCYGSNTHIVDTCEGDSGGPLQTHKFKCLYNVVGVTSYGKDCGVLGSAGMYTRVLHYVPWIESIVWPGETNNG